MPLRLVYAACYIVEIAVFRYGPIEVGTIRRCKDKTTREGRGWGKRRYNSENDDWSGGAGREKMVRLDARRHEWGTRRVLEGCVRLRTSGSVRCEAVVARYATCLKPAEFTRRIDKT